MKSEAMFCYASPDVWNLIPLSVRHTSIVLQFKINLMSHYFSLAFIIMLIFENHCANLTFDETAS